MILKKISEDCYILTSALPNLKVLISYLHISKKQTAIQ
jgi:hypothetical protein